MMELVCENINDKKCSLQSDFSLADKFVLEGIQRFVE